MERTIINTLKVMIISRLDITMQQFTDLIVIVVCMRVLTDVAI